MSPAHAVYCPPAPLPPDLPYSREKDHLFHAIKTVPVVKKKADWALKWIGRCVCMCGGGGRGGAGGAG